MNETADSKRDQGSGIRGQGQTEAGLPERGSLVPRRPAPHATRIARRAPWRLLTVLGGLVLAGTLGLLLSGRTSAHGATVRLDQNMGGYHLLIATGPGAQQPTDLLMTIILSTPDDGTNVPDPITGATVTATLQLTGTSEVPLVVPIPPEPTLASYGYYERTIPLPDGIWALTVAVSGPKGDIAATVTITQRQTTAGLTWVTVTILGLPVLVVVTLVFFIRHGRRRAALATAEDAEADDDADEPDE